MTSTLWMLTMGGRAGGQVMWGRGRAGDLPTQEQLGWALPHPHKDTDNAGGQVRNILHCQEQLGGVEIRGQGSELRQDAGMWV